MKLGNIIWALIIVSACKTAVPQEATKIKKTAVEMKPAIATSSKDTTAKKSEPHARHRDEPIHVDNGGGKPARSHRSEPPMAQPVKRSEASVIKPSAKQSGTFTPPTLKNAPKPTGN